MFKNWQQPSVEYYHLDLWVVSLQQLLISVHSNLDAAKDFPLVWPLSIVTVEQIKFKSDLDRCFFYFPLIGNYPLGKSHYLSSENFAPQVVVFQEGSSHIFTFTSHFFWYIYLSMLGTYSDEFGKLDFERSQHGSGMSNRSQAKRFVSALNSIAERTYNNLFDLQQLRQVAKELQIRVSLEIKHFFNI